MEDAFHHNVLIVDDDPAILYLCRQCLASPCMSIALAHSVPEARQILARNDFDLLITDYEMPGFTGFNLVSGLRKEGNLTPVIFMSGTPSACNAFKRAGITRWEFLDKPFSLERLRTLVRDLVCDKLDFRLQPENSANLEVPSVPTICG